jgi:hypothetical protein
MTHKCCSPECAKTYAEQEREKTAARIARKERQETRAKLMAMKPRSYWMARAQAAVNAWVRWRDRKLPCISCGTVKAVQWHAGHYLTRGAHPELALDPLNINKQCSQCNDHGSGRQLDHQRGILERYGQRRLEYLEGPHAPKKYTIQDLQAIEASYKQGLKGAKE